jgi:hypothetical protein
MPKAAMHEDRFPPAGEKKVRAVSRHAAADHVTVAFPVQHAPDGQFNLRVARADR